MDHSKDYEFEYYEKYIGDAKEVLKLIEECPKCGSRLTIEHQTDPLNLIVLEIAECFYCHSNVRKIVSLVS